MRIKEFSDYQRWSSHRAPQWDAEIFRVLVWLDACCSVDIWLCAWVRAENCSHCTHIRIHSGIGWFVELKKNEKKFVFHSHSASRPVSACLLFMAVVFGRRWMSHISCIRDANVFILFDDTICRHFYISIFEWWRHLHTHDAVARDNTQLQEKQINEKNSFNSSSSTHNYNFYCLAMNNDNWAQT